MKSLLFLFLLFPFAASASAERLKYHCRCVLSYEDNVGGGLVSLEGRAYPSDGSVITVRDYYFFGTQYLPDYAAAMASCAEGIEYKRGQGICY